jgi:hypothetical protein
MQISTTSEQAGDDVVRWRRERLTETGFSPELAAEVAGNQLYDLHALIELVERGCPPPLAVRILAPLEERTAA